MEKVSFGRVAKQWSAKLSTVVRMSETSIYNSPVNQ